MPYAGPASERYAYVLYPQEWPELTEAANLLAARYRRARRPEAALMVERAWSEARQQQMKLAVEMAAIATKELQASEKQTRVRPDTEGQGGPRLGHYLVAEPMPQQSLLPGAIGVANEELLDTHVPWWVTNEIGSTALVGRRIFGLFYGGDEDSPPNMDEFRVHPLFMPAPARAGGAMGIIQHGTPERRFIRRALPAINREWSLRFDAIKGQFEAEIARASAMMR